MKKIFYLLVVCLFVVMNSLPIAAQSPVPAKLKVSVLTLEEIGVWVKNDKGETVPLTVPIGAGTKQAVEVFSSSYKDSPTIISFPAGPKYSFYFQEAKKKESTPQSLEMGKVVSGGIQQLII